MLSLADPGRPQPERFLAVDARRRGERQVVLEVVGHVDSFTVPLLRACLGTQLSRPGGRELVVDLGGVEVLGAAGISVLAEASRHARERGLRFRLDTHGRWSVLMPLRLAGLIEGCDVRADLEADVARRLPLRGALAHA